MPREPEGSPRGGQRGGGGDERGAADPDPGAPGPAAATRAADGGGPDPVPAGVMGSRGSPDGPRGGLSPFLAPLEPSAHPKAAAALPHRLPGEPGARGGQRRACVINKVN